MPWIFPCTAGIDWRPYLSCELEAMFMADVEGCDVVTLEAWRKRGLPGKSLQFLASLLQEQV